MDSHKPLTHLLGRVLAVLLLVAAAPAGAADGVLIIGKVSDDPRKHYTRLKPMVDYVVEHIGDLGITRGEVLMAKDNAQMIRYLKEGRVDWVTETVFSSVAFADKAGAEILLRKWKKGVPEYHSVFITRKDSGIEKLEDLKGRLIAFEDPGSTTAYFLPKAVMLDQGLELVELASPRQTPPAGKVGYAFAGEEVNIAAWVHKGLAAAGAYNNLDWDKADHTPRGFRNDLKIFHATRSMPRALESVRGDLDPAVRQRLIEVLTTAHQTAAGRKALYAYQRTRQIDFLDGDVRAQIDEVRRIMRRLEEVQ